ncbi:MAG TPA: amidohydrolase family protein [Chloroflexota bacterium]|nr:amidohydrolase family protein [Chloroflexota bacterium]
MPYDVVIKGGHVLDPGQGLDGPMDIGITGGRIAAIQPRIADGEAARTVEVRGSNRYVLPGLIDLHTHVAYGATTPGVGMGCVDPDVGGVGSGVTTLLDGGSVGIANVGVFGAHILPHAKTRVLCFVNVGTFAHTTPAAADVTRMEDIDRKAIASCVQANPGLISGFKLRLVGPVVQERGEDVVRLAKDIASEHKLPLMVHIGDGRAPDGQQASDLTRYLLKTFTEADILTHLCTPNPGGVMDPSQAARQAIPELQEARANGVVLDSALGRGNFGYEVARRQAEIGLHPDTISSDLTAGGRTLGVGLLDSMSKFLSLGYTLSDVVRMTTSRAASAIGMSDTIGALAVGREADISIVDVVDGKWAFTDTIQQPFTGTQALIPVQTVRAGEFFSPDWGPYPWGWLPAEA